MGRHWRAAGFAAALTILTAGVPAPSAQTRRYDLAIVNGIVVDGTGRPGVRQDIAVKDGRIAALGRVAAAAASEVIDAKGLVVAPGFIDVHTHADNLVSRPDAANFVRMGVTTIVAGNCGSSALDVAAALSALRDRPAAVNFATLIGHNTVRSAVMGSENRAPGAAELARMKSLVWKGMADGAVGFSTGLQYVPGAYAQAVEIVELARAAASAGGIYASHMRNEGTALEDAVAETIRVGELSGARVQISHLKVDSPNRWGASEQALALIDAARRKGIDVRADQYAYTAASSSLSIRFPSWALEGGPARIAERLNDPAAWTRIKTEMAALLAERGLRDLSFAVVAAHRADPAVNGLSMKQIAARRLGSDSADAQFEAARAIMLAGGASMVYHFMSDGDVDRIMRHPQVGFASDAGVIEFGEGVPHPRGYGNTARVLGAYVRGRRLISLEEAIRKMTSLPAGHFRFANRGAIRAGYAADLVVFDPAQIADTATFESPHGYAAGIPYVVVNGEIVVKNGSQTPARPGQVLANSLIEKQ
ncbi:MAG TPA: D-aminoacylase [Vicinamibacterales bacterium]|nr:D-aminoacylase [Vicinamibacterales bacterium]